jgi:hypothetical protein
MQERKKGYCLRRKRDERKVDLVLFAKEERRRRGGCDTA